jgi:acetylornithine deacetylase
VSEVVELLRSLVRRPSVSGGEEAVRDALLAWLGERGVPARAVGRNVVAEIPPDSRGGAGAGGDRGLLLLSHYDTVPVGPGWTRDPYDAAVEDGKVFGRGSNDAKSSVAAMAAAAAAVDRARLRGRLVLALVCDEETGGLGVEALMGTKGGGPRTMPAFTASVVGEPTGLDVCPGQRGLLRASVTARGRSCHASRPWEGVNAVDLAARDVLAVHAIEMPRENALLGRATLVATMVSGGTRPNVLPGECVIELDGRPTPEYDNETMIGLLRRAVAGTVDVKSRRFEPVAFDPSSEIVRVAKAASPTGRVRGFGGVSDLFHVRQVPGVVLGPGTSAASHGPDEWVAVEQVEAAVVAYAKVIEGYLA